MSRPRPRGMLGVWPGGIQAHTCGGGGWGSGWGVSRPTPRGVKAHTQAGCPGPGPEGGVSQHALRQSPHSRWLLLWAVRILLEYIFVNKYVYICLVVLYEACVMSCIFSTFFKCTAKRNWYQLWNNNILSPLHNFVNTCILYQN